MNKHAYLIMAHNEIYILKKLLMQIDNKHNDIYLHIDKKTKDFDIESLKKIVKKSNLYFVERLNVGWSAHTQILCELLLLKEATSKNKYSYYHLLSGVDLLIKDSEEIYNYFEKNNGVEYIPFKSLEEISEQEIERIKYYHFLNQNMRHKNRFIRIFSSSIHRLTIYIQKTLKVNRLKKVDLKIRKGANWFSITDDLARYTLDKSKELMHIFKHSSCADELFLQTIVYNSKFINKINKETTDEHLMAKRHIDWNRGNPYTYKVEDYEELMNSDAFFARKFSTKVDKEIIDKIYKTLEGKRK